MFPVLHIGPIAIRTAGLILLAGIWIGLMIAEKRAYLYQINSDILYNSTAIAFIAALLGARLVYIFEYFEIFRSDPFSMLSLNPGLLDIWAGFAIGLLSVLIYGQRKKIKWFNYLDALSPMLAVLWLAFSLAHLANGTGYGLPSKLPWAILLWGEFRHPTQLYQAIAGGFLLAFLLYPKRSSKFSIPGMTFFTFLALASGILIFLDTFQADSNIIFSNIRESQIVAWFVLAGALIVIGYLSGKKSQISQAGNHELNRS